MTWDWIELGRLYKERGQLDRARQAAKSAYGSLAGDDGRDRMVVMGELGNVAVQAGDLAGAKARFEEDLAIARKLANVAVQAGDLAGAKARFEESLTVRRKLAKDMRAKLRCALLLTALPAMTTSQIQATSDEDTEIEAARSAGDRRRTLTLLMARHGDDIYRFAIAMTRDRTLAEEVRQQVFVEVYRDLGNLAASSSLECWIFGIARHRCLDALNARKRWHQRYKNAPPEDPEQADDHADRELDRVRLARVLAACLAKLAPATREAVVLRYQRELSYDEAAAIMGDLPSTVRRRVARALPVLRHLWVLTLTASAGRRSCLSVFDHPGTCRQRSATRRTIPAGSRTASSLTWHRHSPRFRGEWRNGNLQEGLYMNNNIEESRNACS